MNKTQLVELIATKTGLSKHQAHAALDAVVEAISDVLIQGETVSLVGFGTFKVSHRAPRVGRNPRTGDVIQIEATNCPVFAPSEKLKEAVNQPKE